MKVGVLGGGSFGITLASLLSENKDVLLYMRSQEKNEKINSTHMSHGAKLSSRITATSNISEVCKCNLLFPVVPSSSFRELIVNIRNYLTPSHVMIHATKGLDVDGIKDSDLLDSFFHREQVHTMSEIIRNESNVVRVGCLSGPNLAREILDGQPAASVLASEFDEVIKLGTQALSSNKFFVFGSHDIKGTELAGAYKNIIALGTGMLAGKNFGKNMQAILITRGLHEMIKFGISLGATSKAFLGTAGIGDLVATATSNNSRNYTFGYRMAQGENIQTIFDTSDEIVEGVRTLKIIKQLAQNENLTLPIMELIYKIVFEDLKIEKAIRFLMQYTYAEDVDFI